VPRQIERGLPQAEVGHLRRSPLRSQFAVGLLASVLLWIGVGAFAQQPAVSGTVRDEVGEPVVNVEVVALRPTPDRRRLVIHGRARTDDRGRYRITLFTRPNAPSSNDYLMRVHGHGDRPAPSLSAQTTLMFPNVYYPSAERPSAALPVSVAVGEERAGIDFTLRPVRGVTVAGTLADPGVVGTPALQLSLVPTDNGRGLWDEPAAAVRVPPGGRFSFANVPPGTYVLWTVVFPHHLDRPTRTARTVAGLMGGLVTSGFRVGRNEAIGAPPAGDTHWLRAPVVVATDDIEMAPVFSRGTRVRGRLVFDGTSTPPTAREIEQAEIRVVAADGAELGMVPLSGPDGDGRFSLAGLPAGEYDLWVGRGFSDWHLRSLTAKGRDLTGRPFAVGMADITDVEYTFTDRTTSITGVLRDLAGQPVVGGAVAAFTTDRSRWHASVMWPVVHIGQAVENGAFKLPVRGAGEYFVVGSIKVPSAVRERFQDPALLEQLARSAAIVRVGEGEQATVNVSAATEP
jgi:hypothetical protein